MGCPATIPTTWSVHEALAVSFDAFSRRYGADVLWTTFQSLTSNRIATLTEHVAREEEINSYMQYLLYADDAQLPDLMVKVRSDAYGQDILHHMAIRWWRARDDLLACPPESRVPCIYAEGSSRHISLQLLDQMLYRGRAPDII